MLKIVCCIETIVLVLYQNLICDFRIYQRMVLISFQAIAVLKFLISEENAEALSHSIALLDPFPDSVKFKSLNKIYKQIQERTRTPSLLDDVQRFLVVSSSSLPASRLEGLRHLHSQIGSRKNELLTLLQKSKGVK